MADLGGVFDANQVEPAEGRDFGLLPKGDYRMAITDSTVKAANSGNGNYLKLEIQVTDGAYANRKLWENLNLWHRDHKTMTIAQGTFSAICRAVGVMTPRDSAELHNREFIGSVYQKKNKQTGELENKIGKFSPISMAANYTPSAQARAPQGVGVAPAKQRAANRAAQEAGDDGAPF